MPDLSKKKQRFAEKVVEASTEADALYAKIVGLLADLFAEGFNEGGANAIVDSDIGGSIEYLDAAKLQGALNALQNVQAAFDNGGSITAIRKAKYE